MAYDEQLAARMRKEIGAMPGMVEKKMFGGIGFILNGNMACGVHAGDMIVRVGPANHAAAVARPHTRPFDLTGRPMEGWVEVAPGGWQSDAELRAWIQMGIEFARSLPAK